MTNPNNIKFAHIAPFSIMQQAEKMSQINMTLAHLVDENDNYAKFYASSSKDTIMDNGAFELGESYNPDKLIELGHKVNAQIVVLPDYPKKHYEITQEAANKYASKIRSEGFKTMFVPQSEEGDLDGYISSIIWALNNPEIDYIGLSIIGAPNALPDIPRLMARWEILSIVSRLVPDNKIHMLGMLDTAGEIGLCRQFSRCINSWDSSVAVTNGVKYNRIEDQTEKLDVPVDFYAAYEWTLFCQMNIEWINKECTIC